MTESRGEQRAETAKRNDDSDIIEADSKAPKHQGRSGGNLERDIATQAEEARATEPAAHESLKKGDQEAHGQHTNEPRPATEVVTERD